MLFHLANLASYHQQLDLKLNKMVHEIPLLKQPQDQYSWYNKHCHSMTIESSSVSIQSRKLEILKRHTQHFRPEKHDHYCHNDVCHEQHFHCSHVQEGPILHNVANSLDRYSHRASKKPAIIPVRKVLLYALLPSHI